MEILDRDTLLALARENGGTRVSVYLPTHRAGSDKEQDRIRFKNLLRDARSRLAPALRDSDADALLARANALLADDSFWRDTGTGLALFAGPEGTRVLTLDAEMPELVSVGASYALRPLILAHRGDGAFFALLVDRGGCRLFRGDHAGIEQVALADVPDSLADSARYDVDQESLQYSTFAGTAATAGVGRAIGVFHGHGGEKDTDKIALVSYLRQVDSAVARILAPTGNTPVVLFGVGYELALYRELSSFAMRIRGQVEGATDELPPRRIHERALAALEPVFREELDADLADLAEKAGTGLASTDAEEIAAAAAAGRVRALFVATGPLPEADGLIDTAVAEVALHGGMMHALAQADLASGVAAVYRY